MRVKEKDVMNGFIRIEKTAQSKKVGRFEETLKNVG